MATIHGPVSSPSLTNAETGERLTYNDTLQEREFVVVDMAARTVKFMGTASRRGLVTGTFLSLPPGGNLISFTAPTYSAAATATLTWRSAWR